jgi:hypothetical protein
MGLEIALRFKDSYFSFECTYLFTAGLRPRWRAGFQGVIVLSIELLWIIPLIALVMALPLVYRAYQKREPDASRLHTKDLVEQVEMFNQGSHLASQPAGKRSSEIESIITMVTAALSNQQKVIETFKGKDDTITGELNTLKSKLHELQQEYDIVISENYSLKARVNKIVRERQGGPASPEPEPPAPLPPPPVAAPKEPPRFVDFAKLYGDTRAFNTSDLDDTSEVNIVDLH